MRISKTKSSNSQSQFLLADLVSGVKTMVLSVGLIAGEVADGTEPPIAAEGEVEVVGSSVADGCGGSNG
jgi:hypothetical protein